MSATVSEDDVRAALAGEGTIDLGATIVPGRREHHASQGHGSIPTLTGLQLGETIGQGGMGIVRVGRQEALGRDVAVKMVRPDAPDDAEWALLAEARITGSLEHPNVIPVHTVGLGGQGGAGLSLVMKRVDGVNLADLSTTTTTLAGTWPRASDARGSSRCFARCVAPSNSPTAGASLTAT